MTEETNRLPLEHLTPNGVLNLAYSFHVVRDPEHRRSDVGQLCRQAVDGHKAYKFEPMSPEWIFLQGVNPIIASVSNGIRRRKRDSSEKIRGAIKTRATMEGGVFAGQAMGVVWRVLWKIVQFAAPIFIFILVGMFLGETAAPLVPERITESPLHDPAAPIRLLMAIFGGFGTVISVLLTRWRQKRIDDAFEKSTDQARADYDDGRLTEYDIAWNELCKLYKEYTGKGYTEERSYEFVIARDRQRHRRSRVNSRDDSDLAQLWDRVGKWRQRRKKRRAAKKALPTTPVPA
jgi:hypothetical protein